MSETKTPDEAPGGIPVNTPSDQQKPASEYERLKSLYDEILEKQQREVAAKIARLLWGRAWSETMLAQAVYEELKVARMHR